MCLAKIDLQGTYLKDFDYDTGEATERERELASTLKVNSLSSSNYVNNTFTTFKDKFYCKNFLLHLKTLKSDELKGNKIGVNEMLVALEFKYTSLLRQNELILPKATLSIDLKNIAITADSKSPEEQNLLLKVLLASL